MSGFSESAGRRGQAGYDTGGGSLYNAMAFLTRQVSASKAHATLVKVISVTGGGVNQPAMVAVQPMVAQVDGYGNQTPHGTIYNIPCMRHQAGNTSVICDPVVGDIGMAIICDRDISKVKDTRALAGPGSSRQNSWSDGCFFGSFLGNTPTTFIQISDAGGIAIKSPMNLTIDTQNVQIDSTGNLKVKGEITAKDGGVSIHSTTHTHTNVQTGGGNSGPPLTGS